MKSLSLVSGAKCLLIALFITGTSYPVYGDIVATYSPAGSQTPDTSTGPTGLCTGTTGCWVGMQTFASSTAPTGTWNFPSIVSSGTVLTDPISGAITGTFSGTGLFINPANLYGGAGGTGYYADVTKASYTLTLGTTGNIPGDNYFGLWFSALDNGNDLKFYDGSTLLLDFTPALFQKLTGACPNAFCGNPNSQFLGQDGNEQFAFLNFFDTTGYITSIVFTETTSAGFESDNFTAAYQDPSNPSGTLIGGTPEPSSFVLMLSGILALIAIGRRAALKMM
jgi:hypothetical protein